MIVISNTSPVTNLAAIGKLDLLQSLYGEIIIPEAVWQELNYAGIQWPGSQEVGNAQWIERKVAENQNLVLALKGDLDNGEAETISLALEIDADLVLLDEHEGRRAAARMGLNVIGVVGVLLVAKENGLLEKIRQCLDALRQQAGFYLSESLYQDILRKADEII